jgi:hypothetical protein
MKSTNWISATGLHAVERHADRAADDPVLASGVSLTRSAPIPAWSPSVTRNTPAVLPTSSPSRTTRGSSRSATRSAS